jgi:hypothetical protein
LAAKIQLTTAIGANIQLTTDIGANILFQGYTLEGASNSIEDEAKTAEQRQGRQSDTC